MTIQNSDFGRHLYSDRYAEKAVLPMSFQSSGVKTEAAGPASFTLLAQAISFIGPLTISSSCSARSMSTLILSGYRALDELGELT